MCIFLLFVGLSLGFSCFVLSNWLFLIFLILVFLAYSFYLGKNKIIIFSLSFVFGFIVTLIIHIINLKTNVDEVNSYFLIVKSEENYYLVSNFVKVYYVYEKGHAFEIGDLVKIEGYIKELEFSHYQESFDFKTYLKSFRVFHSLNVQNKEIIFSNFLKINSFKNKILNNFSGENKNLVAAFLFKDSFTSKTSLNNFNGTGMSLFLTMTGLHLNFIIKFVEQKFFKKLNEKHSNLIIFFMNLVFLVLSSYAFALQRIVLMSLLKLINNFKKINFSYVERLSITGIIILLFSPFYVLNIGFYYSFFILFTFYFARNLLNIREKFYKIKTSLIFLILVLPLNLYTDYQFNILKFPLQILFLPLFSLGFCCNLLALFGNVFIPFVTAVNNFYLFLFKFISYFRLNLISGKISIYYLFFYYLLLLIIFYVKGLNIAFVLNKLKIVFISVLVFVFIPEVFPKYEVHFIDVGQGDATLIRYKYQTCLIDTGGSLSTDLATNCLIPYFRSIKVTSIDLVLITHDDFDHVGSLESLGKNFSLKKVEKDYLIRKSYYLDDLLVEDINYQKSESEDANYNSAIFSFEIKKTKFLIMGDAPKEVEEKLQIDSADVIKLGHHGSNTSSSQKFLGKLKPDLSIISCGLNNIYKHPSKETLTTLDNLGLNYHRTDIGGTFVYKC